MVDDRIEITGIGVHDEDGSSVMGMSTRFPPEYYSEIIKMIDKINDKHKNNQDFQEKIKDRMK